MNLTELFNAEINKQRETNFEPIPEGKYQMQLVDVAHQATAWGNQIALRFKVVNGEQYNNRVVFENIGIDFNDMQDWLAELNVKKVARASEALGMDMNPQILMQPDVNLLAQSLVNAFKTKLNTIVNANVKHRTYTDKKGEERTDLNIYFTKAEQSQPMQNNVIDTPSDDDMPF